MATSTIYKTEYIPPVKDCVLWSEANTVHALNIENSSGNFIIFGGYGRSRTWIGYVFCNSSGAVTTEEIFKGSNITAVTTSVANKISFTLDTSYEGFIRIVNVVGDIPVLDSGN